MNSRLVLILAAAALTAGCGLTGTPPTEQPAESGRMTIDGHTAMTRTVECTQNQWLLQIDTAGDQGNARVLVELGGERPVVTSVNVEGIDDHYGVADSEVGEAKAAVTDGDVYTISGTLVGSDVTTPGETRDMSFEIKAPC
ncbi:lipoprotein LpqH [Mycobacterium sp. SMC-4]|uniref:lipoprotein LpqH n=1 Tax=Mycobacterium sp. SMC-4 TaxID=2857059 RepID=UPI003CFFAB98